MTKVKRNAVLVCLLSLFSLASFVAFQNFSPTAQSGSNYQFSSSPTPVLRNTILQPGLIDNVIDTATFWDGRLALMTSHDRSVNNVTQSHLSLYLFNPELLASNATQNPTQPFYSSTGAAEFSSNYIFANGAIVDNANNSISGCGQDDWLTATIAPMSLNSIQQPPLSLNDITYPSFPTDEQTSQNPYPSDQFGNLCKRNCSYATYVFNVVATQRFQPPPLKNCASATGRMPLATLGSNGNMTSDSYFIQFPGYAVVQNPHTSSASIIAGGPIPPANIALPFDQVPGGGLNVQNLSSPNSAKLFGFEPSLSADGRFLVFQSKLNKQFTPEPNGGGYIYFSYNLNPSEAGGWSNPLPLEQANGFANLSLNIPGGASNILFGDLFPIAKQPLLLPNGISFFGSGPLASSQGDPTMPRIPGAYPWIDQDAANIYWTAGFVKSGASVMGRDTAFTQRLIDTWVNPDRGQQFRRFFTVSTGAMPGLWNPFRFLSNSPLPLFAGKTNISPIIDTATNNYSEFSFANANDGNYALYLEMNELLDYTNPIANYVNHQAPDASLTYIVNQTPDTSGHHNTGYLVGDAVFPYEQFKQGAYYFCKSAPNTPASFCTIPHSSDTKERLYDTLILRDDGSPIHLYEDQSISGQSVYLGSNGAVLVPDSPSLKFAKAPGLTVEMWINPQSQISNPSGQNLISKNGSFGISLVPSSNAKSPSVQGWVNLGSPINHPIYTDLKALSPIAAGSKWTHIAMRYTASLGIIELFINSVKVSIRAASARGAQIQDSTAPVLIGYGGAPQALPGETYWYLYPPPNYVPPAPIATALLVDEVKLSTIARSIYDIQQSALVKNQGAQVVPLPSGLFNKDLRVPASEQLKPDSIQLAEQLFFDSRLSSNGKISCASCHDPSHAFSDPRGFSIGVAGTPLPRVAPIILDRAFSSVQMWDGAANSLESQVALPLTHQVEMGMTPESLSAFINSIPTYQSGLQSAIGANSINSSNVLFALGKVFASLERSSSFISANSLEDGIESNLLSDNYINGTYSGMRLFFGKARCASCHGNSNYSDENFHRTILFGTKLDNSSGSCSSPPVSQTAEADTGREQVTGLASDCGKFKTPSLRNVSYKARFFHNGAASTLAEVVNLYNDGAVSTSSYPADGNLRTLGLTPMEKIDLVHFLESLKSNPGPSLVKPNLPSVQSK